MKAKKTGTSRRYRNRRSDEKTIGDLRAAEPKPKRTNRTTKAEAAKKMCLSKRTNTNTVKEYIHASNEKHAYR